MERSASGVGQLALVEGEAGVGKTRLLAEVVELARRNGCAVFLAAGEELEARRPFGAVTDALGVLRTENPLRARIAGLLAAEPEPTARFLPNNAADVEFLVSEAIIELVEQLCSSSPVVVAVDDLHWADPSSVFALHRLSRHLASLPALFVSATRPLPRRADVEQLARTVSARHGLRIRLQPLDDEWLAALVESLVGGPAGPNLLRQAAAAGGNPLFVTALVEALQEEGAIAVDAAGMREIHAVAAPSSLTVTLLHRLSFLPQEALEVLGLAAVLGRRFSVIDLATVTDRPVAALTGMLCDALRAGVLVAEGERLAFRHDLVREALYADLPLPVRVGLHRDFAAGLAAAGADRLTVAEHLLRGASPGDEQAVTWLHDAARQAAPRAPAEAVELLERGLALAQTSEQLQARLRPELAVALIWAGRPLEGEAICRHLLASNLDATLETRLRLYYTQSLLLRGRVAEALEVAQQGLTSRRVPAADQARLQAWASLPLVFAGDLGGAADPATAARAAADDAADLPAACQAMQTLSLIAYFQGRFHEALALSDEAIAAADRSDTREAHRALPHSTRATALMQLDRLDDADQAAQAGRAISEAFGMKATLPIYHFIASSGHFWSGRWDDALAEVAAGVEIAEETGTTWSIQGRSIHALVALHRGDTEAAETALAAAEREFAETGLRCGVAWMMLARARLLQAIGRAQQAAGVLAAAWDGCAHAGLASEYPLLAANLVRVALDADDRDRAGRTAAAIETLAARNPAVSSLKGLALRCRGMVDDDLHALVGAAEMYRSSPRMLERGQAAEDAAAALAADGRTDHARGLLDEAVGLYQTLGAVRDTRRATHRLRSLGVRRGSRGPRGRPRTGWEALTETERNVADLVVQGLTNPQIGERLFISRHTVHTHVSNILAKVGVASRVELAATAPTPP